MNQEVDGFHHIKLPVSDVPRSRDWYARVLGLQTHIEFVEDGALRGVAMRDAGGSLDLALRHDPERARALAGFDPIALRVPTPEALTGWQRHLADLDQPHGGLVTGHAGCVLIGLHDPDGIEIRLYLPIEPDTEGQS